MSSADTVAEARAHCASVNRELDSASDVPVSSCSRMEDDICSVSLVEPAGLSTFI